MPVMKSRPDAPSASAATSARGNDGGARVREHAEGVPLPARQHHLRVGERRAAPGDLGPRHQDGGAARHAGLLAGHEPHGLLTGGHLGPEERGREVLERQALGAVHHGRRQILEAQPHHPLRELPAERRWRHGSCRARLLRQRCRRADGWPRIAPAIPAAASADSRRKRRRSCVVRLLMTSRVPSLPNSWQIMSRPDADAVNRLLGQPDFLRIIHTAPHSASASTVGSGTSRASASISRKARPR